MMYFHKTTDKLMPTNIELVLMFPDPQRQKTGFYRVDMVAEIKGNMCKLKRLNDWSRLPTYWQVSELSPDENEDYL